MRIDSATGTKAWLIGKFSGSFKGNLEGVAESASYAESASFALIAESASYSAFTETASYSLTSEKASTASFAESSSYTTVAGSASFAETASYMTSKDLGKSLDEAIDDPDNCKVLDKILRKGRLNVFGSIRVSSGSVEVDSGSVRIGKVRMDYDSNEDALHFIFVESEPVPPVPPCPDCPPPIPPGPPRSLCPFYPENVPVPFIPPFVKFSCQLCPVSGSSCTLVTKPSGSFKSQQSIDYIRGGRY